MPWGVLLVGLLLLLVILVLVLWRRRSPASASTAQRSEERSGFLLVLPWLAGFLVFMAGPIVLSLVLALSRWNGLGPLSTAEFVGLGNFNRIFLEDQTFWQSLKVTGYYVLLAVPLGQVFALLVALLLNARLRGIEFFRAAFYLPSVLAGVGMSILFIWVFKSEGGMVNTVLAPVLSPLGLEPPEWFNRDAAWFGVPAFALSA